ncbi:serine protease Do [Enhydrobacter aerosaccus]|uniref:Serine protease Do n=1 Tax=Enhydrobacter aerosaccus TaxID=225324 RepID=A0A1T4QRF1_9HYPH|nr:trypsin-like peptidase domain-containing protein [Enhydrobacter aerosaccus]SKA06310.1 serine protease Do [Enhydrobacter aerosaccus]
MRFLAILLAALVAVSVPATAQIQRGAAASQVLSPPTLAPLVRRVAPAVVSISIRGHVAMEQNPLFSDPLFRQFFGIPEGPIMHEIQAVGSGVIVDPRQGLIVTNNHVVEHADDIAVTLADGRQLRGRKIGGDARADIAFIQVPPNHLESIPFGDADALQVGDYVIAIGNPFGIGQTVTHGIISAVRRTGIGDDEQENFIQTDAAINPGNSGGALVDMNGTLVGINTAIIGPSGANVGIGFAIPVNTVRLVMDRLMRRAAAAHNRWQ